jgi:hypothetical protein
MIFFPSVSNNPNAGAKSKRGDILFPKTETAILIKAPLHPLSFIFTGRRFTGGAASATGTGLAAVRPDLRFGIGALYKKTASTRKYPPHGSFAFRTGADRNIMQRLTYLEPFTADLTTIFINRHHILLRLCIVQTKHLITTQNDRAK